MLREVMRTTKNMFTCLIFYSVQNGQLVEIERETLFSEGVLLAVFLLMRLDVDYDGYSVDDSAHNGGRALQRCVEVRNPAFHQLKPRGLCGNDQRDGDRRRNGASRWEGWLGTVGELVTVSEVASTVEVATAGDWRDSDRRRSDSGQQDGYRYWAGDSQREGDCGRGGHRQWSDDRGLVVGNGLVGSRGSPSLCHETGFGRLQNKLGNPLT